MRHPRDLSDAIRDSGVKNLTVISNNAGVDGIGLGRLLETRQIKKMISSYVGENKLFAQQYLAGELELEFNPQGTLAERIRAGGAGIPAFYTKTGVGTVIAEGKEVKNSMARNMSWNAACSPISPSSMPGRAIRGQPRLPQDRAELQSDDGDRGKITVAEVEHLVPAGEIDPDHIHTAGIFVKRIVEVGTGNKRIEFRNTRPRADKAAARQRLGRKSDGLDPRSNGRARGKGIARRLLRQSRHRHSDAGGELHSRRNGRMLQSENGMLGMGPFPYAGEEDADLINAGKQTVSNCRPQLFLQRDSFGMVRGGHIDLSILGAMQVAQTATSPTG